MTRTTHAGRRASITTRTTTLLVAVLVALLSYGHFRVGITRTASLDQLMVFRRVFLAAVVVTALALVGSLAADLTRRTS